MIKQDKKTPVEPKASENQAECKNQIEKLTGLWKRALADYQNLEKRQERERGEFVSYANTGLILKFLAVLDHLERAENHLNDEGLTLAIKEFKKVLFEEGLAEIQALGEVFNPVEMEAVEITEGDEDNKVAEVVNKGYRLKEKVIRPVKVKVSKKN